MARPLTLLPIDRACAALITVSPQAYAEQHDLRVDEVADSMSAVIGITPPAMLDAGEWGTFFASDADTREVVGACGFKSPPGADRTVEIAYFSFPPREGRGLATAMAAELTARAKASGAVDRVIAHTLPHLNASTRVLEKSGFLRDGEFIDPDDGLVWRWKFGA